MRLRYVKADVQVEAARPMRFDVVTVGWLPADGWFCTCEARRCEHIALVRSAIQEEVSA